MTTIVNTPPPASSDASSGLGIIVGVVVGLAIIILFVIYGLPRLKSANTPQSGTIDVNVQLPPSTQPTPPANNP